MTFKLEYFGKFILLDKIAAGGMAEVFRAKSPGAEGIGKILAIKRILPQFTTNSEFIEMFKSEANIAINLTHGNIASIYEFGEQEKNFYLVMEFIDGKNLRQILSRCSKLQRSLTIEQCVFVVGQVANGLDYAHRCTNKNTGAPLNIIHRDMSPQNIMASYEGEIKIIDFGIAKAESKIENTRAGTLKGKFGYMSPEQAEGLELDCRTDIFSTGIILWELLTGERLFIANNEVNTIRKIRECQIPSLKKINPNIHDELERITMKALAKDRSLRYQTAAELYRDLSRFLYKVNPEFTQHELSVFIKSLFKEDILDDRKKIAEFAKINIPAPTPKPEENTETMGETRTVTDFSQSASNSTQHTESTVETPNLLVDRLTNAQAAAPKSEPMKELDLPRNLKNLELSPNILRPNPDIFTTNPTISNPNRRLNRSNPRIQMKRKTNWSAIIFNLSVVTVLGGGLIYLYANRTHVIEKYTKLSEPPEQVVLNSVGPTPTPHPMVRVFVNSIPIGAEVEVDGKQSGTTPLETSLPVNLKVTISLRKDGFLNYSKDFEASQNGESFTATLQKALVGYLNIEVQPSMAEVFINGQKLTEHPPIKKYTVPANEKLQVRAVNPYTGAWDQVSIAVKQDRVESVRLFPRQSKSP